MLAYESSAVDLDRQLARSCFDNLSVSLAKPTTLRVHPQRNFGWLSDEQILAVSADICEDFLRRKQVYDDEGCETLFSIALHISPACIQCLRYAIETNIPSIGMMLEKLWQHSPSRASKTWLGTYGANLLSVFWHLPKRSVCLYCLNSGYILY